MKKVSLAGGSRCQAKAAGEPFPPRRKTHLVSVHMGEQNHTATWEQVRARDPERQA